MVTRKNEETSAVEKVKELSEVVNDWKRKNIPTYVVLGVFSRPLEERYPADKTISDEIGAPQKVVWAAMERDCRLGYLEYGINLRGGWLTDKGKAALAELQETISLRANLSGEPHHVTEDLTSGVVADTETKNYKNEEDKW